MSPALAPLPQGGIGARPGPIRPVGVATLVAGFEVAPERDPDVDRLLECDGGEKLRVEGRAADLG